LATLMLFGFDFSLIALIGIILLIGIVKKNGIMLVISRSSRSATIICRRGTRCGARRCCGSVHHDDDDGGDAWGVPLMLGTGTGSEIRQPLGYAMVGGLLVSQTLTLFTTP